MFQTKIKGKVCIHVLSYVTAAPEPASLLREGSGAAMCPRLWTPPDSLGGLQRYHVPKGSGPHLTILKGYGTATRPSTPDPALPLKRGPMLTRVLQLWTAPASKVGFGADTCPMALQRSWAATASSEAHVFLRHTRALPRRMQDMRADDVIMNYKPYGQALQHCTTVHHRTANRS
jgi:hypothetical protein